MSNITLQDRVFSPYLHQAEIAQRTDSLAQALTEVYAQQFPLLLVVLKGAFRFAADLVARLDFPLEVEFIRLASYENSQSSGQIRTVLGLEDRLSLEDRPILIVEDIVDTGLTLDFLYAQLQARQAHQLATVSLLFKPDNFRGEHPPAYFGFSIPPAFVVGYGLDYQGQGRQLNDIFREKPSAEV
ncbi:MAG: hypoxanthine phosphoribosyltransferase [Microscillaceae bacterium]|nr:hypoxanthine phosphoribosyltransferase [Microscillaceae bacterium]